MRTVIVAGPRRGKSTLARELSSQSRALVYCGDPRSKVKEPLPGVMYLPEGIPFAGDDGAAEWVQRNWLGRPGHWICEGHVMARALRRWMRDKPGMMPCDQIVVLDRAGFNDPSPGQNAMHTGVMRVWREIEPCYRAIVDRRLSRYS